MAKLTNVKTLEMVGGTVTKIEYEGELYEKVSAGEADQIGDIVAGKIPITASELSFFEVIGINDTVEHKGTGMFYDEDGDYNGMLRYDTFRKVDTSLSGLKKVDAPIVGGKVIFAGKYFDVTAGKVYEIIRTKDSDSFTIIDDVGDYNAFSSRYAAVTFYVKAAEQTSSRLEATSGTKTGDTVEMTSDCLYGDYHEGEQFVVKDDGDGEVYIDDNDGDARYIDGHSHLKYKIVGLAEENTDEEDAPMSAPLFAKVNRPNNEPIVGDFVEFDLSDYRETYFTEGKSYEVVLDSVFDLSVVDDEGDNLDVFNHMRPIKAIFVKYTKPQAEQKAKIGDKVLIVDEDFIHSGYGNGDIVTVKHVDSDGDIHGVGTGFIAAEEFIVLTDAQSGDSEGEKEKGYIPQEGDIVVITGNTNGSRNKIGDIGKVGEIDIHDARVFVAGRPTMANWTLFDEMRPATDEEKAKYLGRTEEVASAQSEENSSPYGEISVGDKVKVVVADGEESEHGWGRVNNGDIGVVTDADFLGSIRVDFPNQKNWYAEESELIKVADNGDLLPGTFFRVNQGFLEGTIAEITGRREHCDDCGYGTAYDHTNDSGWLGTEQFDVLPKEEAKKHVDVAEKDDEAEELIPADEIPIGTIVKVIQEGNGHYGETLRVTKNDGSGIFPYYTEKLDGGFADVYDKEHLEIVEEPAQEEKIEVGDLVKVIQSPAALPEGSHFIVKDVNEKGYVYSTFKDGTTRFGGYVYMRPSSQLKLIAKADDLYA
ncbi:hypothetical protein [Oceanobacillus neutriphilus]|uniref:Uncharacterized protein n=1 Tax=Oceanobacillus neutriphilus TaxID=531815 RepID=A0ABQ2NYA8_9BACI|nr:hypothetical protein [Oceanobacillus neutriphilus]GGP13488.1 hypothetical protein GCM10011346_33680 [Oceanobacillus neutriphilus]